MKFFSFLLLTLATSPAFAQTIAIGDNLQDVYRKIEMPYFFKAPQFTTWSEGRNMLLIGNKPNPNTCDVLILALEDTTMIGVFKTTKPQNFLIDTEGSSLLNTTSDFFFLPEWVVKRKTMIVSTDKTVMLLLDKLYETTMQANDGQANANTIRKYQQFQTDTALANRHIALLFDTYQTIITETAAKGKKPPADICVPLMKTLAKECIALYDKIPAIVCVYMGEALENAGMEEDARTHFKMALQFYPNSIPLQVYNYKLEPDKNAQEQLLVSLKKRYGKHWMVKDL